MASVDSLSASPANIATSGGTSVITPKISDPDKVATVTISVDGSSGTAQVNLHENLTFSTNIADKGKPGVVVAEVDQGSSVSWNADGTLTFTAS